MLGASPPSRGAPKQLSSRLMTMKFMQRGAASSPGSSTGSTPDRGAPANKRQKTEGSPPMAHRPGPSTGTRTPKYPAAPTYLRPGSTDEASANAPNMNNGEENPASTIDWRRTARNAAHAEEARRQEALDRIGARDSGETKWVLTTSDPSGTKAATDGEVKNGGLRIVVYGGMDDESEDEVGGIGKGQPWREDQAVAGRMRFGKWKVDEASVDDMAPQQEHHDHSKSSRSSSPDGTPRRHASAAMVSPTSTGKFGTQRRAAGGISSGGGAGGGREPRPGDLKTCHRCGQTGHIKSQCPKKQDTLMDGVKKAIR